MTRNSSTTTNWITGGIMIYFAARALRAALKRKADEEYYAQQNGTNGVGTIGDGEYVIKAFYESGGYGNVKIFCGWNYDRWNGEKYARWGNPLSRWGIEYDEKVFKTRKGAEKAVQDLIARGEDTWNDSLVEFEIITWDEYVNRYIRR